MSTVTASPRIVEHTSITASELGKLRKRASVTRLIGRIFAGLAAFVVLMAVLGAIMTPSTASPARPAPTPSGPAPRAFCEGTGTTSFCHIATPDGGEWLFNWDHGKIVATKQ